MTIISVSEEAGNTKNARSSSFSSPLNVDISYFQNDNDTFIVLAVHLAESQMAQLYMFNSSHPHYGRKFKKSVCFDAGTLKIGAPPLS